MKKVLFSAIAGSAILLAGCSKGEEATPVEATPAAEASVDASAAASGEVDAGDASEGPNEVHGGGPQP
jgi:PBP1b-binding outer membrane lipoprotein LpoB